MQQGSELHYKSEFEPVDGQAVILFEKRIEVYSTPGIIQTKHRRSVSALSTGFLVSHA